jgi:hypothetical protein
MENLRSTFPLDDAAIGRKALRQILADPITWVPLLPAVAAYTLFDVPALLALVFGIVVLGGVAAYWRKQWAAITGKLSRTIFSSRKKMASRESSSSSAWSSIASRRACTRTAK